MYFEKKMKNAEALTNALARVTETYRSVMAEMTSIISSADDSIAVNKAEIEALNAENENLELVKKQADRVYSKISELFN